MTVEGGWIVNREAGTSADSTVSCSDEFAAPGTSKQ
jgi:hypothetical protein